MVKAKKKEGCIVPLCTKLQHCKGYCKAHYGQLYRNGRIGGGRKVRQENGVYGCDGIIADYTVQKQLYSLVIGVENRIKYRRKIAEIERIAEGLGIKLPT